MTYNIFREDKDDVKFASIGAWQKHQREYRAKALAKKQRQKLKKLEKLK